MNKKNIALLAYLTEIRDEAVEKTKYSRAEGKRVREYKRGNQIPDDVRAKVESRGQPIRWENIIFEADTSLLPSYLCGSSLPSVYFVSS